MEPQQARMTFAGFVALSVTIVFNALFLQADAGLSSRVRGDVPVSVGLRDHATAKTPAPVIQGSQLVLAIRRELSARNYFPGKSIGPMDAMTTGAIMAYQHDSGQVVSGLATDALLKSFLFGVETPAGEKGMSVALGKNAHQLVAEIQGILSAKGHYGGKIDGVFKAGTIEAVKRFESDRALPVTGRISGLLVQELQRVTGVQFGAPRS